MSTNRFVHLFLVLLCIHIFSFDAFCEETYRIDNNRVLLYKIINWWYDCLPDECDLFCGKTVECDNRGNAEIEYSAADMTLKLKVKGGFADLFSIFKACKDCYGPSYLECRQLNRKYFGNGKAVGIHAGFRGFNEFVFNAISSSQAQSVRNIKDDIKFVLKGRIGGLVGGKVALHQAGQFQKACPKDPKNQKAAFPITLKIVNAQTDEILAIYSIGWNSDSS